MYKTITTKSRCNKYLIWVFNIQLIEIQKLTMNKLLTLGQVQKRGWALRRPSFQLVYTGYDRVGAAAYIEIGA